MKNRKKNKNFGLNTNSVQVINRLIHFSLVLHFI